MPFYSRACDTIIMPSFSTPCIRAKLLQLYLTPCNPMDNSLPDSSVHGILQARNWSGLPCPAPGDLPNPGIEPEPLTSLALAGGFFTTSAIWEAPSTPYLDFYWGIVALQCCVPAVE